jgi:hypothetical protein
VRKAGHFKGLHCQPGSIRQIEPQRQFGRVPTRGTFDVGGRRNSNRPSSAPCVSTCINGAHAALFGFMFPTVAVVTRLRPQSLLA